MEKLKLRISKIASTKLNCKAESIIFENNFIIDKNNSDNKINKVLFNFIIEGHIRSREELLFNLNENISLEAYNSIVEPEKVPYQLQKRYDSKIWKNKEVLAPSEELKSYQ